MHSLSWAQFWEPHWHIVLWVRDGQEIRRTKTPRELSRSQFLFLWERQQKVSCIFLIDKGDLISLAAVTSLQLQICGIPAVIEPSLREYTNGFDSSRLLMSHIFDGGRRRWGKEFAFQQKHGKLENSMWHYTVQQYSKPFPAIRGQDFNQHWHSTGKATSCQ